MKMMRLIASLYSFIGALLFAGPLVQRGSTSQELAQIQNPISSSGMSLDDLLRRTADYCKKLESAVLNFVCTEKVEEIQNAIRHGYRLDMMAAALSRSEIESHKSEWLYDYQMIRKLGIIDERRTLLQENGKKKREENTSLRTTRVWYKNVVAGPVGLLGSEAQKMHNYRILDETTISGKSAVIVEVTPRTGITAGLFGKVWIRNDDAAILKIEWEPESMGNYDLVVQTAHEIDAKPKLTFISEYDYDKNGIRFPSGFDVTEAYILPQISRPFVKSKTTVTYYDYKFFTVETAVIFK